MPNVDINGTVVNFPDDLDPEFLNAAVAQAAKQVQSQQPQQPKPGMMGDIGSAFKSAIGQVSNTPMGVINGMQNTIDTGARKLGEMTTRSFMDRGINAAPMFSPSKPMPVSEGTAQTLGKAVEYGPTAVSLLATPLQSSGPAVKAAVPMARRALGFQKSMLKTPFARGQATKAAETALEEGVIDTFGSPQRMFDRASELATKSGEKIKGVIKDVPVDIKQSFDNLDVLKNTITQGAGKEGNFSKVHSAFDAIKNDIADIASSNAGENPTNKLFAKNLNKLKNRIGNSLNYLADQTSQLDNKDIVNNLANTVRDAVKKVIPPQEFAEYLRNQRLYHAADLMKKGLNNEIAGQMGNKAIGPYSAIAATGQLAAGQPMQAAATLGITEGLMRRGAGMSANFLQSAGTNAPALSYTGARGVSKFLKEKDLPRKKAEEFLDEANGDKVLARKLAKQAGYKW